MKKIIARLCNNILNGKFAHKRYRRTRSYYGLELHIDSEYRNGNFGMSVSKDGKFVCWIYFNKNFKTPLNINGRPYKGFIDNI